MVLLLYGWLVSERAIFLWRGCCMRSIRTKQYDDFCFFTVTAVQCVWLLAGGAAAPAVL